MSGQSFADIAQRLQRLGTEQATKVGQSANRAGATALRKEVEREAPVSDVAEGETRNRTTSKGGKRKEVHHKIIHWIRVRKTKSTDATTVQTTVYVSSKAYHAAMVEFGSIHNTPNPFFRAAIAGAKTVILSAMRKTMEKQLIKRGV